MGFLFRSKSRSFLSRDCLVFDIGACTGESLPRFKEAGTTNVVSVEPELSNFLALATKECIPIHAAAWSHPGLVTVRPALTGGGGLSSCDSEKWSQRYPDVKWGAEQVVPAITLDMLRDKFGMPTCIKIDAEGCEEQVIRGLSFKPAFLTFEFHDYFREDINICLRALVDLGFVSAHFTNRDFDYETVPKTPIQSLIDQPSLGEWGNVVVA